MPFKNMKKGTILIARPSLNVDVFSRSVVLLIEHNLKGSMGFIINKPIELTTKNINPKLKSDQFIYNGGPVGNDNLFFIHKRPDLINGSIHIVEDIYWGGDFEDAKNAINSNLIEVDEIKFFIGYAGWGETQLFKELKNNEWEVIEDEITFDIFDKLDNNLWKTLMEEQGGENLIWLNTPADPSMN